MHAGARDDHCSLMSYILGKLAHSLNLLHKNSMQVSFVGTGPLAKFDLQKRKAHRDGELHCERDGGEEV